MAAEEASGERHVVRGAVIQLSTKSAQPAKPGAVQGSPKGRVVAAATGNR